jgi:outer membrane protein TolC
MKTRIILLLCMIFISWEFNAQDLLDDYIQEAFENNLALKQKKDNYNKSLYVLKEAVSYYYPQISIEARYSVADGGRVIDFPVGDLLNPVYSTLNQLTMSEEFPLIDNEEISFLRAKEHETKIRATQLIFHPTVYYNKRIQSHLSESEFINIAAYKRELVTEVKKAYFNWLKTVEINMILEKTEILLKENIRVNEKLYENNKVTKDIVYRSKSELSKLLAEKVHAENSQRTAAAYFNFLLNKPLDSPLESSLTLSEDSVFQFDQSKENAIMKREEILKLQLYSFIAEDNLKLNKAKRLPTLTAVVDYGFQGSEYSFTHNDDFVMASVVLSWDLFTGHANRSKTKIAEIEKESLQSKLSELENSIELQVLNAYNELKAYEEEIETANEQLKFAEEVFRMTQKKYKEGLSNLLEFIDARTNLTNAQLSETLAVYEYKIKYVEYEKVSALYDINQ